MAGKQLVDPIMKEAVVRVSASKAAAASVALEQAHRNGMVKMEYDALLHPPPFPIQQMPVFTPIDQTKSEKGITILENEDIACFTVGGEKRLCLPQILNSVLREFSLQQINSVCDELHIYCSRCSPEQLEILKVTGILPFSAPSCGLITKTDAERLCNALLHGIIDSGSPKSQDEKPKHPTENSMKVYHECFGKCKGLLTPELYEQDSSSCIECLECGIMLTPQKFIVHGHRRRETRTCHWGFDSDNWRNYLLLARDQNPEEKYTEALDNVKAKFDPTCKYKRKQGLDENGNAKRHKGEVVVGEDDELGKDAIITSSWPGAPVPFQRPSAFRPWSPSILQKEGKLGTLPDHGTVLVRDSHGMPTYLSMGPPVLLNPERVVPHTAASKFDSQFAPNVALAPPLKVLPSSKDSLLADGEKERDIKTEDLDVPPESTMEQEIEMVKTMLLESDALDTRSGREKLLHELARIRIRQEERLQNALAAKRNIQQEMEFLKLTKKDKMREAMESKRSLRKELDRLRIEYERKLRESSESRQRLKRDLEMARSRRNEKTNEMGRDNERLVSENEYLKDRVKELEEEKEQLRKELEGFRREKTRAGKEGEETKEEGEETIAEKVERLDASAKRDSKTNSGNTREREEDKEVEKKKVEETREGSNKVKVKEEQVEEEEQSPGKEK